METSILIPEPKVLKVKPFNCLPSQLKWSYYQIRQQNSCYNRHLMTDGHLFKIKYILQ
jgi:hypothetical protein